MAGVCEEVRELVYPLGVAQMPVTKGRHAYTLHYGAQCRHAGAEPTHPRQV